MISATARKWPKSFLDPDTNLTGYFYNRLWGPPPPSKFDNTLLHLHVSVLITVANYPPAVYFCWIEGRLGDQGWKEKIAFICLCIVNFSSLCIGNFSPLCIINFSSAPKGGKIFLNSPLSKQCNLRLQPKIHNAYLTKMWLLSTSQNVIQDFEGRCQPV